MDPPPIPREGSFILATQLFFYLLGFVHFFTWLSHYYTADGLFSPEFGLIPLSNSAPKAFSPWFWWTGSVSSQTINALSTISLSLSFLLMSGYCQNGVLLFLLYLAQVSLLNTNAPLVRNYGWEWQIAETTLAGAFLAPWFGLTATSPPIVAVIVVRWLAFRVMWGAGMSKLGGHASPCWSYPHFSCTTTHYETQPLPSPLAFFLHRLPFRVHQAEVLLNHLVELILPYGFLLPASLPSGICGLISIGYMMGIIVSGSYATINWISITSIVMALDDAFLCRILPNFIVQWRDNVAQQEAKNTAGWLSLIVTSIQIIATISFALWIVYLSRAPIAESLSPSPWLNVYNEYYICNSYGVFGFVNSKRYVVITSFQDPNTQQWTELVYKILPSDVKRVPRYSSPFHYRLDWQLWIETTATLESRPNKSRFVPIILANAIRRLMKGDEKIADLFANGREIIKDPSHLPRVAKFQLFLYTFSQPKTLLETGDWWERATVEGCPPLFLNNES